MKGLKPETERMLEHYNAGLKLYFGRDFGAAMEEFRAALDSAPGDGPSRLYLERCRRYMENPPPEDWDGVFAATTK
ncbi:MAG: hypothetical protein AB1742_15515 [bacterium]